MWKEKKRLKHTRKEITCPECGCHEWHELGGNSGYIWCNNCSLDYRIEDGFTIRRMAEGSYYD